MKRYRVIEAYKSPYPNPIIFHSGDIIRVGNEYDGDPDWLNWIWCEAEDGRQAWVPKQYIQIEGNKAVFNREYNALELSVSVGDEVIIHAIVSGFGLAEKIDGAKGWVPMKCMQPQE